MEYLLDSVDFTMDYSGYALLDKLSRRRQYARAWSHTRERTSPMISLQRSYTEYGNMEVSGLG